MSTWWESNIYSSVWNTLYQIWISGVLVLEGPISLSGQLHWVWITLSFLSLVKKLLIFEYKWVNIKLYSSILCEHGILKNLLDFYRKVWTTLKFKEDSKLNLFQKFNLQSWGNLKLGQKGKLFLMIQNISMKSLMNYRQREGHHFGFQIWKMENHEKSEKWQPRLPAAHAGPWPHVPASACPHMCRDAMVARTSPATSRQRCRWATVRFSLPSTCVAAAPLSSVLRQGEGKVPCASLLLSITITPFFMSLLSRRAPSWASSLLFPVEQRTEPSWSAPLPLPPSLLVALLSRTMQCHPRHSTPLLRAPMKTPTKAAAVSSCAAVSSSSGIHPEPSRLALSANRKPPHVALLP
jgi:hypothetical protein